MKKWFMLNFIKEKYLNYLIYKDNDYCLKIKHMAKEIIF